MTTHPYRWIPLLLVGACGESTPPTVECADGEPPVLWYPDLDGDGHGDDAQGVEACTAPDGHLLSGGDCDDTDAQIHPGAWERCETEIDEDCDGLTGNDDAQGAEGAIPAFPDTDGDGKGDANADPSDYCTVPGDAAENTEDCDDTDPATWIGAAYNEDTAACMTDADGDGYGAETPSSAQAVPGIDCDDTLDTVYRDATEVLIDGVDQDCDGKDQDGLYDDFELAVANPRTWQQVQGDILIDTQDAVSGTYAMTLSGGGGTAQTRAVDTSMCAEVWWWYEGRRGSLAPGLGEVLEVQWFDGTDWNTVDSWEGTGVSDADFIWRSGVIQDPLAISAQFGLRLERIGGTLGSDDFLVDDFYVGCPGIDGDGDGLPALIDCDDTTPAHWSDCGLCIDYDGDDYGDSCDLGLDCDDGDPSIHPGAAEMIGDGIDHNCDGDDGTRLFDDFELGTINPLAFASISGDAAVESSYVANGSYALRLGGGTGIVESVVWSTIDCPAYASLAWSYLGKRGPEMPDPSDTVTLEWWDGAAWITAYTWFGGTTDSVFSLHSGQIIDPAALWTGFKIRFTSSGTGLNLDDFYLDDVSVRCFVDEDGDGVDVTLDCDDTDPWHWSDCGQCVDLDLDGYGPLCDLGDDCDDGDPNVHPEAIDPFGDGMDTNCDGVDGTLILLEDDFELGTVDASVWQSITGDYGYDSGTVNSGTYSLRLGGGIGTADSVPIDTLQCGNGVEYSYFGKRGPETPDSTDFLRIEYWDGTTWVIHDTWYGDNSTDPTFLLRQGVILDANAISTTFQLRFHSDGTGAGFDDFYVDDLEVACAP